MKDLVFVKFNSKLKQKREDKTRDPFVVDLMKTKTMSGSQAFQNRNKSKHKKEMMLKLKQNHHHNSTRKGREVTRTIGRRKGS